LSANGDELSDAAIAVGDPFATFSRVRCVMAEWQAGEQCKIRHKTLKHGEIGRLAGGGMRLLGVAAQEPPMTTQLRGALFRCGGGKGGDTLDAYDRRHRSHHEPSPPCHESTPTASLPFRPLPLPAPGGHHRLRASKHWGGYVGNRPPDLVITSNASTSYSFPRIRC
jgi:hypothetical protein